MVRPVRTIEGWPRRMTAATAAAYCDEASVEIFRRGIGKIWPLPKKIMGKAKNKPALGRPPKLGAEHIEVLRALVAEHPLSTMAELNAMLAVRTGVSVSLVTLGSTLRQAGVVRVRPCAPSSFAVSEPQGLKRYGYKYHAKALTESSLEMVKQGGFHEYFQPLSGEPLGAANFSWTAALTIDWLKK